MFDIGQKVVCVDDSFFAGINDIYNSLPEKDKTYTVRDVVPAWGLDLKETCGILLQECVNRPNSGGIEPAFQPHRFRELDETPLQEEAKEENYTLDAITL